MCQFVCEYSNTVLFPEGESHTCSVFDCEDLTVMQVCLGKTAAEHSLIPDADCKCDDLLLFCLEYVACIGLGRTK